jgi:uncharacterized membrane protein
MNLVSLLIPQSLVLDIPNWWYASIFFAMLIIAIFLCYASGAHLPWYGLLLAVGLACVMVLPIGLWHYLFSVFLFYTREIIKKKWFVSGIIQAISNNQVGLNVISEMICG